MNDYIRLGSIMDIQHTHIEGLFVCRPRTFIDSRGFFLENYRTDLYTHYNIPPLLQWNHSRSSKGVLRGIHVQYPHYQGKLIYVIRGAIYDVAVDLRPHSETYGQHFSIELNDENHAQLWIPEGFGHAFYTLSDTVDLLYGCTNYYISQEQYSIRYDDPTLAIDWSCISTCELSDKDNNAPLLADTPFAR